VEFETGKEISHLECLQVSLSAVSLPVLRNKTKNWREQGVSRIQLFSTHYGPSISTVLRGEEGIRSDSPSVHEKNSSFPIGEETLSPTTLLQMPTH
jgi:hypothetical protein